MCTSPCDRALHASFAFFITTQPMPGALLRIPIVCSAGSPWTGLSERSTSSTGPHCSKCERRPSAASNPNFIIFFTAMTQVESLDSRYKRLVAMYDGPERRPRCEDAYELV